MGRCVLWQRGFKSVVLSTADGQYRIWSRVVDGSHPLVFLPGVGAGVVPYIRWLDTFHDRSVYAIEVPNVSEMSSKMSYRQAQPASIGLAFHSLGLTPGHIALVAHSFGTIHAAMLIQELPVETIEHLVLMEPFCHPVHMSRAASCIYNTGPTETWVDHVLQSLVGRDLEIQTSSRLFSNDQSILWQPEKCRSIMNIFCTDDVFLRGIYDDALFSYLVDTGQQVRRVRGSHNASLNARHQHLFLDFLEGDAFPHYKDTS